MPSSFNDKNLHHLSEDYIVVSSQFTVLGQSMSVEKLFGCLKGQNLDSACSLTHEDRSLIRDPRSILISDKGFHLFHSPTKLGFSGIAAPMTEGRKALILKPDDRTQRHLDKASQIRKLGWEWLYHMASSFNLQIDEENLFKNIAKIILNGSLFDVISLHSKSGGQLERGSVWPNRSLSFTDSQLNEIQDAAIGLLSSGPSNEWTKDSPSFSIYSLETTPNSQSKLYFFSIPVWVDNEISFHLNLYSSESTDQLKIYATDLIPDLSHEINRQWNLFLHQSRERDQVVELAQSSRLSSIGAMAGGIAHEINNPLTVIMGMLKVTIKELGSDRPLDRVKMIETLEKARQYTERISKIVKGIRALSRDGSRDPFILSRVQDILDNTFALCEAAIKTNGIQLTCDLDDPEMMIQCRPVQISQVLLNLINNSTDAIGSQSDPWIHVSIRKVDQDIPQIEFSVTDSGAGIPEHIAHQLMQPFFTTKGAGKGTGLGLSISQEIIKSHSGKFYLDENFPNTRFVFHFPLEQSRVKAKAS